jgi:hypothetical protein
MLLQGHGLRSFVYPKHITHVTCEAGVWRLVVTTLASGADSTGGSHF